MIRNVTKSRLPAFFTGLKGAHHRAKLLWKIKTWTNIILKVQLSKKAGLINKKACLAFPYIHPWDFSWLLWACPWATFIMNKTKTEPKELPNHLISPSADLLERLSNHNGDGYEMSLKKWICTASNFIALIRFRSVRQMLAVFSGGEF